MAPGRGRWTLARFDDEFDLWVERARPSDDIKVVVLDWVISRFDDPYSGAVREPNFDNLWRARIPETTNDASELVYCVYFIRESQNVVTCHGFEYNSS